MPADPSARASDLAAAALTRALRAVTALRTLTLPDIYQAHDTQDKMYAEAGLNAEHLVQQIEALVPINNKCNAA